MSKLRSLVSFASWSYGAQLITVVAQFGYAAITSRIVDDVGFGQYAIALSVSALILLLANGGLGQTVSRMDTVDPRRLSALVLYAVLLGAIGAVALAATADLWAGLWGSGDAAAGVRFLGISVFLAPLTGLVTGLLRRQGRFKRLAFVVVATNIAGMALGLVVVVQIPGAIALLVSPVTAIVLQGVIAFALNFRLLTRKPDLRAVTGDLSFSWRVTALSIVSYLNGNIGRWAVTRGVGVDVFGQWNRADVITTVPMQQLHQSIQQAIYPEFRHDVASQERARVVWTDMLILMAWIALPFGGLIALLAPAAIPILFGGGWALAAPLSAPLALVVGVQMVTVTLGSALEAIGRFRLITATHIIALIIYACGAWLAIYLTSMGPVILAMFAAIIAQHTIHVTYCAQRNTLDTVRLLRGYLSAALFATLITLPLFITTSLFTGSDLLRLTILAAETVVIVALVAVFIKQLPAARIVGKYWRR